MVDGAPRRGRPVDRRAGASGFLRLRFERRGTRTVLADLASRSPLQVSRVLDRPDGWADVYLLNPSGGLLGGDDLAIEVRVDPGARVRLRTPGATKVYRSTGVPTRQRVLISVAAGSALIYLPEPLIPFAGAWLQQAMEVDTDPNATACLGEVVGPGRWRRGERFAYRRLAFDLEVRVGGYRQILDHACLEPARWRPGTVGRLGRFSHVARLFLLGRTAETSPIAVGSGLGDEIVAGRSRLPCDAGTLVTALGSNAFLLQSRLERMIDQSLAQS